MISFPLGISQSNDLFSLEWDYRFYHSNNVAYSLFPGQNNDKYNSNSFTAGLLNAANINLPHAPLGNVPGWKKPLPINMFKGR